jgi:2-polyprenyl-3-methyl-5-hydroxy-6-metoxy-1,4-benzoquinol methylase
MTTKPTAKALNRFLKTRNEINQCTEILRQNNLIEHGLDCKNFDIKEISAHLTDGNLLDMGASGSFILHNAIKLNLSGRKVGIDLSPVAAHDRAEGAEYFEGDLMKTPFSDGEFQNLTCLSVIEHQVDYSLLAKECARLLKSGGQLFLTCDYFNPKPDTSAMKLYSLDWNILDKEDVLRLVSILDKNGLKITSEIDWTTQEAVINPTYCSPANVSYTFGIFHFIKQ